MNEWISVKNKMPISKETVIVTDGKSVFSGFFNYSYWLCWSGWKNLNLQSYDVTHWMLLPDPPINT
jgi:hypothetical protein